MPSTYTTNLGLEKPATGEQAGNWGVTANKSYDLLDDGIDGNVTITLSASAYTLLTNPGILSDGRNKVINFIGAITSDASITISPNTAEKIYFVSNHTTGGHSLVFTQGTGTSFTLYPGFSAVIFANGGGNAASVYGALADLQVNSLLVTANLSVWGSIAYATPQTIPVAMTFSGGVTISPSLRVDLPGSAGYDLYYRSTAGPLARLAIGAAGQLLSVGGAGPTWINPPSTGINSSVSGSQPYQIFFANAASQLVQDPNLNWGPGVGLAVGRAPASGYGIAVGTNIPPKILLDGAAGGQSSLAYATAGARRWAWELNSAEAAGNVGSEMYLSAYDNAGNFLGTPIAVLRRNGHVSLGRPTDLGGTVNMINVNSVTADVTLVVQAVPGQASYLQEWRNAGGGRVASIDAAGNFYSAMGSTFLSLDANRRLDINGTAVSGHPQGTLHIGADAVGINPSIVLEDTPGAPNALGVGCRIYFRRGSGVFKFVVQFMNAGGTVSYASMDLNVGVGGTPPWLVTATAP